LISSAQHQPASDFGRLSTSARTPSFNNLFRSLTYLSIIAMAPNGHYNGGPPAKYHKAQGAEARGFEGMRRTKNETP